MKMDKSRRKSLGRAAAGVTAAAVVTPLNLEALAASQPARGGSAQARTSKPSLAVSSANGVAAVTKGAKGGSSRAPTFSSGGREQVGSGAFVRERTPHP
jgi:hypothetical protein